MSHTPRLANPLLCVPTRKRGPWRALALLLLLALPGLAWSDLSGEQVYLRHCVHCHEPGVEPPGTRQLGLTRGTDKAVLTERKDLAPEYIRYVVRNGLQSMPAFVPSDLTEAQLDALTEYLTY